MKDIRLGMGTFKNVYAGKIKANGKEWKEGKCDVTEDFRQVFFQYLLEEFTPGEIHLISAGGKPQFEVRVTKIKEEKE